MLTVLIALLPGGQVTTQVWYNTCRHATSRRHSPTGSRRSARRRSTPARRPACGPKVAPPSSVSHKSAGRWHYQMVPEEGLEPSCPGGPDAFKARLSADSSTPAGGAVFEALGDPHLEGLRLLVHLVPGDAHDLDEERLDQPVAADHVLAHLLARIGERDELAGTARHEPLGLELAHHLGHARGRVPKGPGEVGGAAVDPGLVQPVERLQVFLDGWAERLGHGSILRGPWSSSSWGDRSKAAPYGTTTTRPVMPAC